MCNDINMPNIWGQGQLFAFSGLEGPCNYYKNLCGTLMADFLGIQFRNLAKKSDKEYFDEDVYSKAVELLKNAQHIGCTGCGHSGILCQHFAHLMCCIERPAKYISPAEAVHVGTGFLQKGDVCVFASRGGKTKELLPIRIIKTAPKLSFICWTGITTASSLKKNRLTVKNTKRS